MDTGQLRRLLKTTSSEPRSTAEVSDKITILFRAKAVLRLSFQSQRGNPPWYPPNLLPVIGGRL
jgi:hypothetical protein